MFALAAVLFSSGQYAIAAYAALFHKTGGAKWQRVISADAPVEPLLS